jgi:YegS/Rv2252/BmrU family lipid kinase
MYHFIINPTSSSGKGKAIWRDVENMLKQENEEYEAHVTKSIVDATEITKALTTRNGEENHIVVLGGDGTLNAVLNGIENFQSTKLSCISTGSGNDFANNMNIDQEPLKALNSILHSPSETVLDYGEVSYIEAVEKEKNSTTKPDKGAGKRYKTRRFIISSGVGYDADICEEASRSTLKAILNKVHLGKLVYVAIGVKQIFTRKSAAAVIRLDGDVAITVPNVFFVVGMIHEREGGGVPFCPQANPRDGMLDVCMVRDMPKWKLLLAVMLVYVKRHLIFKNITVRRCRKIHIQLNRPQWFHMDGETPCKVKELELRCRQGLRFVK